MHVELFDSYPHSAFEPKLRSLVASATRLDAAIAFVTPGGTAVLREFLRRAEPGSARLVASVRYPTNILHLADLAERMPDNVFIHTGFKTPEEEKADRGQFHSKIALIEYPDERRCIVVGSHNWTENALAGHNLEAATIIHCEASDPIVEQVRTHIEMCVHRSEPFDPSRVRFYQTVQRDLHPSKPPAVSEDFPGFEPLDALVIHAEDSTNGGLPNPMRLFIPVREPVGEGFFATGQRVMLFLYPPNSLNQGSPPSVVPVLLNGQVTMNNAVTDAPVDERAANCQLQDLRRPAISLLAGNVPPTAGEQAQVVIRLERFGEESVPLFHSAQQSPKMKLGVHYEPVDQDGSNESKASNNRDEMVRAKPGTAELSQDFQAPHHLVIETIIRVPSQFLYSQELRQQLNYAIYGSEFFHRSDEPHIQFGDPRNDQILNRYVYLVNYQFTKEALSRIQKQMRLFEE